MNIGSVVRFNTIINILLFYVIITYNLLPLQSNKTKIRPLMHGDPKCDSHGLVGPYLMDCSYGT